ncbi:hypothetical protein SAMN05428971_1963 [Candidatus Pantoea varia]|uniref:Uncharacterized protein n=1 Tax=Candidatus Pantoea varia TaxID=1881036 RepID=A0A1I5AAW3_9GAMM|nr:hypothetical protein [Pantoea varia]SFN59480.1 hypothetical protein SAMN05428971_1963 [Pantoea varia]
MKKDHTGRRDYPIKEDMRWIRREWRIQRIGEYVLIALVILGACGLFSKGVLSNGSARSPDGTIQVEYERFGRVESNMDMLIRYNAPVTDRFNVTIGGGALDNLQIQTLQPQPLEAVTIGSDLRLTFSSRDTGPDHAIWIGLQPRNPGRIAVSVSSGDHPPARFNQWIYP